MARIYTIGNGIKAFARALATKGHTVRALTGASAQSLGKLADADLVVVEGSHARLLRKRPRSGAVVPAIVLTEASSPGETDNWLEEPFTYPLHNPTEAELVGFATRVLDIESALRTDLMREIAVMRKEIDIFEAMSKALTNTTGMHEILALIAQGARNLIGAAACALFLVEEDEKPGALFIEKIDETPNKRIRKVHLPKPVGVVGWVAHEGKPALIENAAKDARFSRRIDAFGKVVPRHILSVPIKNQGRTIGVLQVSNRAKDRAFTESDMDHLLRLADQAALAVERINLYQRMEELSVTDDLTNLFNIRYLTRSIESEIARSKRYATSVSLIFLDLDHFKDINDNFGHLIGSKLLVELSKILLEQLRSIDIVIRYGGDEFVIILPQTILNHAMNVAERIRRAVEQNVFLQSEGLTIRITSSFGVAAYPESAKTKEELLRLADEAMYKVKNRTRNGVYAII
jgi:diguanylate cyclase (GGDEF)-like protein